MRMEHADALMAIAKIMAQRSSCSRTQVGVIIAREGRILSSGYNGTPAGMSHCNHTCICRHSPTFMEGYHYAQCPAAGRCSDAIHAETNAIVFAARIGVAIKGADLYTSVAPCHACAQLIIGAGIKSVFYGEEYRVEDGLVLLSHAGLPVKKL